MPDVDTALSIVDKRNGFPGERIKYLTWRDGLTHCYVQFMVMNPKNKIFLERNGPFAYNHPSFSSRFVGSTLPLSPVVLPWLQFHGKPVPTRRFSFWISLGLFPMRLNFNFNIYLKSPIFYYTLIVNLFLQLESEWLGGIIKNYQLLQITARSMSEILTFSIALCAELVTESTC